MSIYPKELIIKKYHDFYDDISDLDDSLSCVYLIVNFSTKLPPYYIGSTTLKNVRNGYMGSVGSRAWKTIWKEETTNNPNLFKLIILDTFEDRKEALDMENFLQEKYGSKASFNFVNMANANTNGCFGGVCKNLIWIKKDNSQMRININDLQQYESIGWTKGRQPMGLRVYRDEELVTIKECDLQKYLDDGWTRGIKPSSKRKLSKKMRGRKLTENHKQKIRDNHARPKGKDANFYGKHHTEETKQRISNATKGKNNPMYGKRGKDNPNTGLKRTEEQIQKIKDSKTPEVRKRQSEKVSGEKNQAFGKKWIYNKENDEQLFLPQEECEKYLLIGYEYGQRKQKRNPTNRPKPKNCSTKGRKWMYNPQTKERICIFPEECEEYVKIGFRFGTK